MFGCVMRDLRPNNRLAKDKREMGDRMRMSITFHLNELEMSESLY